MLFDSHTEVVSGKNFGFWQYCGFSGGKLGPKMDQNHHLWVRLVSAQPLNKIVQGLSLSYERRTSG